MDMLAEQPIQERSVRDLFYEPIQELHNAITYHDLPIEMYFLYFPLFPVFSLLSHFERVAEMRAMHRMPRSGLSSHRRPNGAVNVIASATSIIPVSHAPAARVPIKPPLAPLPSWELVSIALLLVNISVLLVRRGSPFCIARDAGK